MRKSIIGMGVLISIIGLMMIIAPETFIKIAVILLGITAIGNGIYNLMSVLNFSNDSFYKKIVLTRAIISIFVGVLSLLLPLFIAGTIWVVLIYTLAVYLLISAALEIINLYQLQKEGYPIKLFRIEIISSILLAILLFTMPAQIGITVIRIIAFFTILVGIGITFYEWKNKSSLNSPINNE
jgi:uncharacterized membrane protein HdeD (DUF308 family)